MDWMDKGGDLFDFLKDVSACMDTGFNKSGCSGKDIIWRGTCMLLGWQLGDMLLFDPGIPFEDICRGEPPLKCCKYNPSEAYCHSAFNSDEPINCEGNPSAPDAEDYGECLPLTRYPGDPGCLCDYIPQCTVSGASLARSVTPPGVDAWRGNRLGVLLARAVEQGPSALFRQSPGDFADYVSFVGTQAHQQVMLQSAPFAKPDAFPEGYPLSADYHANDNNPDARYLRGLVTLAVQRVYSGIPNLYARWNAVAARNWTEPEAAAYLAQVPDPDAVLESCVGNFGLRMLQRADPVRYRLLTVPLAGETEPDCRVGWRGGAALGSAPSITATTTLAGATVTLSPNITDPDAARNASGRYAVRLDWGDGRVEGRLYTVAVPASHAWSHTYEHPGSYTVTARVLNTSGLMGETTVPVSVTQGSGVPVARSVARVRFDLEATVTAGTHGYVRVEAFATDVQGKVHALGAHWAALSGAYNTTVTAPLSGWLTNRSLKDIRSLSLKPFHYDSNQVALRELRLKGVTLELHASPGMAPATASYALTHRDVKIHAAGAPVPTSPLMEPATGQLKLPLTSAEIVIDLPAPGVPPDAALAYGCRPVYGSEAPLMRSAQGGCEDIASGLVFAVIPARMNWHDAVWDSALAGSPEPDVHDHGRINDFPGGYRVTQGPDLSPSAYCHDLDQGGFSDWRLPTEEELLKVASGARAGAYFPYAMGYAWTSTNWDATTAVLRDLPSAARGYGNKSTAQHLAVCVRSAPPPAQHVCRVPADGGQTFLSEAGGCRDTRTGGRVWSKAFVAPRSWHAAVWGSELPGNAQPDIQDSGRLNDYAGGVVPANPDASTENLCHDLVEGGFSDWRLPTDSELRAVSGASLAAAYFAFDTADYFWSSSTWSSPTTTALGINLSAGGNSFSLKTAPQRVVCVRTP
ncbi:DUF1566 domain-containing protein [Corallococcus exiguus]|uniref:Lcl domain-containing protein n=1 Tax=Corallococcus exiguus TaxID=83462 RepID=UPI001A8D6DF7|nr:DUF1566 domain-containing protein [Corallococcus exiguus]MBN8468588.1 DUF1566 domain-containing protein [Corallococcus exiguus]